jgi:hypothetical protein
MSLLLAVPDDVILSDPVPVQTRTRKRPPIQPRSTPIRSSGLGDQPAGLYVPDRVPGIWVALHRPALKPTAEIADPPPHIGDVGAPMS